jgi:hypothetical protein
MAEDKFGIIDNQSALDWNAGLWQFDTDDWALIAMLQDPIHCAELLFKDPKRRDYGGCYHVDDFQYPLFRGGGTNDELYPCARSVGKTESLKADAVSGVFQRQGEDKLVTAPYMIHLKPLTQAIEARIRDTRLTREFLDTRGQKTGFTHDPFQVDFLDNTRIVGRIPLLSGVGVKGQHVPDARMDESQDYPPKGWLELYPTIMRDHVNPDGEPDYSFRAYGVHSGIGESDFYRLSKSGEYKVIQITAMMRPSWSADEKRKAAAMYGGTQTPDYKRNILGEAGGAASAFFVTSRLMACIDQDPNSSYNTEEWKRQSFAAEEIDSMLGDIADKRERDEAMYEMLKALLDLPDGLGQQVYTGADLGLVNDPTVISLWHVHTDKKKKSRLRLIRLFHLWRFREKMIRQVAYIIAWKYGKTLRGAGWDVTGLGLPLFQAMEADEVAPQHLLDASRGYIFSAKVPIGVDKSMVTKDTAGQLRDHYGNIVEVRRDPFTAQEDYIVKMSMIEASTRYLREDVDSMFLQLPFDTEVAADMQGETEQRVKAMAGVKKKPSAFHILDSFRTMAMVRKAAEVEEQIAVRQQEPVLARAVDTSPSVMT